MFQIPDDKERTSLTPEEKKRLLYEKQKAMLAMFLEHGAIDRQQYEKSLGNLTVKMGYSTTIFPKGE